MKTIATLSMLILTGILHASVESVCSTDTRSPVKDPRIGRLKMTDFESACTVTMIGKSCAISAGHCMNYMKTVEFNVPPSKYGKITSTLAQNSYEIDPTTIVGLDDNIGNDWAVMKIKANRTTGKFPGEVGGFYPISSDVVQKGEELSIAGYGRDDRGDKTGNGTLQIARGPLQDLTTNLWGTKHPFKVLIYQIDTEPGDSGSVIIRERDQSIVGIHTNGGSCGSDTGNMGTLINSTKRMATAIQNCLAE